MSDHERQSITSRARQAIHAAYGTPEDEFGATLFVSHHLEELDSGYWEVTFEDAAPEPSRIIDGLIVTDIRSDETSHTVDFTLPGSVTDGIVCVVLGTDGDVRSVAMES